MTPGDPDLGWMDGALALAARGIGLTAPNPVVGAVVVQGDRIVGQGAHVRAGGPHAEVAALAEAGPAAAGATCYVTLEPCAHHGRTPPCADALVAAGVARVVVATIDPNPRVRGAGLARLRAAGVAVRVGVREPEAAALNRAFFRFVTAGRSHVTLKVAMTLDGRVAAVDGTSRWITGEEARAEAHRMRFAADAVLVGIGTVLQDDPALTVRIPGLPAKEPLRVVANSALRIPPQAQIFAAGDPERVVVACVAPAPSEAATRIRARKARVLELPGERGRVSLPALLEALARLDVVAVLAEGGPELAGGLVEAALVDRVAFFVAPRLVGGRLAPGPLGGPGRALKEAVEVAGATCRPVGEDFLIEGDVSR